MKTYVWFPFSFSASWIDLPATCNISFHSETLCVFFLCVSDLALGHCWPLTHTLAVLPSHPLPMGCLCQEPKDGSSPRFPPSQCWEQPAAHGRVDVHRLVTWTLSLNMGPVVSGAWLQGSQWKARRERGRCFLHHQWGWAALAVWRMIDHSTAQAFGKMERLQSTHRAHARHTESHSNPLQQPHITDQNTEAWGEVMLS